MNFGKALEAVKDGKKIFRLGWNGKGMFVVYQKGYPDGIPCNLQTAKAWGMNEGDLFKCEPYLQIKTADGSCNVGSVNRRHSGRGLADYPVTGGRYVKSSY